jgi:Uma2 family endonuclease
MIVRTDERDLCVTVPPGAHTLAGFRDWVYSGSFPERGCISLIEGELFIDMSPERLESHSAVKLEVTRVLATLVHDGDLGQFLPDGMWITNDEAGVSNEPDAMFAGWESFERGAIELIIRDERDQDGIELRGTPDWILEVISPSSVRKDTQQLPLAYFRAGVREYWLIDARGDTLRFTIFVRGGQEFVAVSEADDWRLSDVFAREFRLERVRDRLGGWKYTLRMREAAPQLREGASPE